MTIGTDALAAYERGLAMLVLATVVEATPAIGRPPSRSFVAATLVGSVRRDLVAADAHRLTTFGALAKNGLDAVYSLLDAMVEKGFLEVFQGRRGVVCTALGRSLLDGHVWRSLGVLPGAVDATALDLAVRSGLVEALRRFRAEVAGNRETPEYRVLSEAALREIATRRPTTTEGLEGIPGIGPKFSEHAPEVLRIVAEHMPIIVRLESSRAAIDAENAAAAENR